MKKKIIVVIVLLAAGTGVFAQGESVMKFFSKYSGDESFTSATVSSKMFSLFTNMEVESPEDQEVLNAISKLKGLRILGKENTSDADRLYKEAAGYITKDYEQLMEVRDPDKNMKFYITEKGGKISELLMLMGGKDDFMIMSLFGEIDLKQISKIGHKMNVGGLENLQKMDDGKKKN